MYFRKYLPGSFWGKIQYGHRRMTQKVSHARSSSRQIRKVPQSFWIPWNWLIGSTLKSSIYLLMYYCCSSFGVPKPIPVPCCTGIVHLYVFPFDWKLLEGRDSIIFLLCPESSTMFSTWKELNKWSNDGTCVCPNPLSPTFNTCIMSHQKTSLCKKYLYLVWTGFTEL